MSDMKLRILDYLENIQEVGGVAICGRLRCSCGLNQFLFSHTGRRTKGALRPYIVREDHQLILKACCPSCNHTIIVYSSVEDGVNTVNGRDFQPFIHPQTSEKLFSATVKYNYRPENLKCGEHYSNRFENCFIYIADDNGKEDVLIEE